ncbi:hypothetical protein M885DRAFT_616822 [Pelagophyceae sp. CCMP2097]|nr:hypothetical protein M885DRAFT_616822 [Pelagophyceae sp. CCMP2097]
MEALEAALAQAGPAEMVGVLFDLKEWVNDEMTDSLSKMITTIAAQHPHAQTAALCSLESGSGHGAKVTRAAAAAASAADGSARGDAAAASWASSSGWSEEEADTPASFEALLDQHNLGRFHAPLQRCGLATLNQIRNFPGDDLKNLIDPETGKKVLPVGPLCKLRSLLEKQDEAPEVQAAAPASAPPVPATAPPPASAPPAPPAAFVRAGPPPLVPAAEVDADVLKLLKDSKVEEFGEGLVSGALARCGVTSKGVLMKISPEQITLLRDPKTRQRVYKVVYKLRFHVENDLQQFLTNYGLGHLAPGLHRNGLASCLDLAGVRFQDLFALGDPESRQLVLAQPQDQSKFRSAFPDLLAKSTTLRAAKHNLDVDDDAQSESEAEASEGEASEFDPAFSEWLETGNLRRLEPALRACGIVSAAQLKLLSLDDLRLLKDGDGAKLLAVGPLSRLRRMLAGDDADASAADAPAEESPPGPALEPWTATLQQLLTCAGLEALLPTFREAGISSISTLLQREQELAELRSADGSRAVLLGPRRKIRSLLAALTGEVAHVDPPPPPALPALPPQQADDELVDFLQALQLGKLVEPFARLGICTVAELSVQAETLKDLRDGAGARVVAIGSRSKIVDSLAKWTPSSRQSSRHASPAASPTGSAAAFPSASGDGGLSAFLSSLNLDHLISGFAACGVSNLRQLQALDGAQLKDLRVEDTGAKLLLMGPLSKLKTSLSELHDPCLSDLHDPARESVNAQVLAVMEAALGAGQVTAEVATALAQFGLVTIADLRSLGPSGLAELRTAKQKLFSVGALARARHALGPFAETVVPAALTEAPFAGLVFSASTTAIAQECLDRRIFALPASHSAVVEALMSCGEETCKVVKCFLWDSQAQILHGFFRPLQRPKTATPAPHAFQVQAWDGVITHANDLVDVEPTAWSAQLRVAPVATFRPLLKQHVSDVIDFSNGRPTFALGAVAVQTIAKRFVEGGKA